MLSTGLAALSFHNPRAEREFELEEEFELTGAAAQSAFLQTQSRGADPPGMDCICESMKCNCLKPCACGEPTFNLETFSIEIDGGCYCMPGFSGAGCEELDCPCDGGSRHVLTYANATSAHVAAAAKIASALALVGHAPAAAHLANVSCGCACHERGLTHGPTCTSPCPKGCSGHGSCDGASGACTHRTPSLSRITTHRSGVCSGPSSRFCSSTQMPLPTCRRTVSLVALP